MYPGSLVPFVAHRARDRIQLNTLRRTANTIPAESEPRKRSVKSRANGRSVGTMRGPAGENINKSATNYETQTSPFYVFLQGDASGPSPTASFSCRGC